MGDEVGSGWQWMCTMCRNTSICRAAATIAGGRKRRCRCSSRGLAGAAAPAPLLAGGGRAEATAASVGPPAAADDAPTLRLPPRSRPGPSRGKAGVRIGGDKGGAPPPSAADGGSGGGPERGRPPRGGHLQRPRPRGSPLEAPTTSAMVSAARRDRRSGEHH